VRAQLVGQLVFGHLAVVATVRLPGQCPHGVVHLVLVHEPLVAALKGRIVEREKLHVALVLASREVSFSPIARSGAR
jgi:hypothetical protein